MVDDEPENRKLLSEVLTADGYRVSAAAGGEEALELADTLGADAILMDVMMPDLDGLLTCRCLKAAPATAPIPVIMVTAQKGRKQKMEGIAAGANDFLSKPVDLTELRLKVRNSVHAKKLHDRVEEEYRKVTVLEETRDRLVHMVVHDIRSALTAILLGIDMVDEEAGDSLDVEVRGLLRSARDSACTLTKMTETMLDLSRLESGSMPIRTVVGDLHDVLESSLGTLGPEAARVVVEVNGTAGLTRIGCDPDLIERVLSNLVGNALAYSEDEVVVAFDRGPESLRITVTDRGPGIPPQDRKRIFERFGQVEGRSKKAEASTGLGLAFCKLAVEAHAGTIGVESEPWRGVDVLDRATLGRFGPEHPSGATGA